MRTRQLVVACVLLPIIGLAGCGDEGGKSATRRTEVVTATIRFVAADVRSSDVTVPDELPVVYVVSVGEESLSAGLQADVVAELRDDIDVRFSDSRDEAIDETTPTEQVRDDGVLIVIGEVPKLGNPVAVPVEIYHARHEHTKVVLTFVPAGDEWEVTATSEVPLDAI